MNKANRMFSIIYFLCTFGFYSLTLCTHQPPSRPILPTDKAQHPLKNYYMEKFIPFLHYLRELERRHNIPKSLDEFEYKMKCAHTFFEKTGDDCAIKKFKEEQYKDKSVSRSYPFTRDLLLFLIRLKTDSLLKKNFSYVLGENISYILPFIFNTKSIVNWAEYGNRYFLHHEIPILSPIINYFAILKRRQNNPETEREYWDKVEKAFALYEQTGDSYAIEQLALEGYKNKSWTYRHPFKRDVIIYAVIPAIIGSLIGTLIRAKIRAAHSQYLHISPQIQNSIVMSSMP